MPSDARTDDSGFVGDDDLGYGRSRTRFTAGEPLRLDETYRLAHLPLVAPDSAAVIARLPGRPYEMGRHPRIFSLVLPVDDGALRRSPAFARLEADLASAPFAGKIAWDLLPRRAHRLHATICGSLSQDEPPQVTRAQREAMAGMPAFDAVLRGLFSGNVNRGRLYLRLYPQSLAGTNPLSTIQSVFGRAPSGLYLVGLYNLTADLDPAETAALAEIIDRHWDETWLQIRVCGLDMLGAGDDLVLDSEVVETLPFGRPLGAAAGDA